MNLAQVIEYDYDNRTYRICPEKVVPAPRDVSDKPPQVVVREHRERKRTEPIPQSCIRRALRRGGHEVVAVLQAAGRIMRGEEIEQALPSVHEVTLRWRLSNLTARGDITRYGERKSFKYGLPGGSTSESS